MLETKEAENLRWALDLAAFAENLMRQRFQEENPQATEDEIEDRLLRWMQGLDYDLSSSQATVATTVAP